uniref:Uncharacterized protein n=1 Tax=viral metagenome TaxID=1070528 RepID=A0A6C0C691_9ZZZZ
MNNNQLQCDNPNIIEDDVLCRLNNYTDSHPNIVSMWKEYIKLKHINYMKSIVDCDEMLRTLESNRDVSVETIALLYALFD